MVIGERVNTLVAMPGLPAGKRGRVAEIGHLFVVVEFEDGRTGYYRHSQLGPLGAGEADDEGGEAVPLLLGSNEYRVPPGTHICLLASTPQAQLETISRYLIAGLQAGEECVCAVPCGLFDPLAQTMAEMASALSPAVDVGSARFKCADDVYAPASSFTAERQLEVLASVSKDLGGGMESGTRIYGQPAHLVSRPDDHGWWEYERQVTSLLKRLKMTALCGYEPDGWQTQAWRSAYSVHPYVLCGGKLTTGGGWTSC